MEKLRETPSQTVGPFFAYGLTAVQYGYDYTSIANDLLVDLASVQTESLSRVVYTMDRVK